MRNVMKKAWEIARKGQKQFGGKVSEYLAEALKMAWEETELIRINTTSGSKKHKSWVAEITGTHSKWKLNREFVEAIGENDFTGKTFELQNGKVYEICNAGDCEFIQVVNGKIEYMEYAEVTAMTA